MSTYKEIEIEQYEITGCYIRSDIIVGFVGRNTTAGDPHPTRAFAYYLDNKEWGFIHLDKTYGVLGCETYTPEDKWIFATVEGHVIAVGGGNMVEKPLPISEKSRVTQLRCIDKKAYAVTTMREVYRRDNVSKWTNLSVPIMESEKKNLNNLGFDAIDGFSENDIYACGSHGDGWHYDGKTWQRLDLPPTNAMISDMVCGDDGNVYIIFWHGLIVKGRNDQWEIIKQSAAEQLESVAWFKGHAYIATWNRLYKLVDDKLIAIPFDNGYSQKFCGHLVAGYGNLISAGPKEAHIFDGKKWNMIFNY